MEERSGKFVFEPPPNIPGGDIVVDDAVWEECTNCGERVIPHALNVALDNVAKLRQS